MTTTLTREDRLRDLHTAHAGAVLAFLLRVNLGNLGDAEDLAQKTWIQAWKHLDDLDDGGARRWLFTVAKRASIDARRARESRPVTVGPDALQWACARDVIGQAEIRLIVEAALANLDEMHRHVIEEHYLHDRSIGDIAAADHIPAGTVKSRIHYGVRALRAQIGGEGL